MLWLDLHIQLPFCDWSSQGDWGKSNSQETWPTLLGSSSPKSQEEVFHTTYCLFFRTTCYFPFPPLNLTNLTGDARDLQSCALYCCHCMKTWLMAPVSIRRFICIPLFHYDFPNSKPSKSSPCACGRPWQHTKIMFAPLSVLTAPALLCISGYLEINPRGQNDDSCYGNTKRRMTFLLFEQGLSWSFLLLNTSCSLLKFLITFFTLWP